jgi:hypothetical protein
VSVRALGLVLALVATPVEAATLRPACGVTGYVCSLDFTFGTTGTVRGMADLHRLFTHDAPWGRINDELETFPPFNALNHVFRKDCLALTGIHDGSTNYTDFGHITSGALLSKATCMAPCIVEFVAKLPAGRGCWPSMWLYDVHSGKHDASEIDVLESQNHPPNIDRSMVFQFDHGPGAGPVLGDPGHFGKDGFWRPYGPMPGGDLSARYAAYSVLWLKDRTVRYVDDKEGITRAFHWTGPESPNLLVYLSLGTSHPDSWPGPVLPETFVGENATLLLKSIRVFVPAESMLPK